MKKLCHIFLLLAAILSVILQPAKLFAQSDAQLTQYWAVPTLYNPAAAGSTDWLRIRGAARLQWLGIENAPKSFLGTADIPFRLMNKRFGAGVTATSESLGLFSNLLLNAQLSYKFKFLKGELGIGAAVGYLNSRFKGSEVYIPDGDDFHQSSDLSIPTQDLSGNAIDFSAGLQYTHRYFNLGVSVLHALDPKVSLSLEGSESTEAQEFETEMRRMFYFTAGGNIPLKNTLFELQPSVLVKTDLNTFSAELTLRSTFNKFLSFGLGYRWKDAVSVMIGAEIKNFIIGYAYDYPISAINKASSGSHELFAGYQLKLDFSGKNKNKHRSIRIM